MKRRARVLIAEDHTIVRQGLRALLQSHPQFDVVGEAADGDEAVRCCAELSPCVVVMDVGLPGLGGIEATRRICAARPLTRVVMLSMHADGAYVRAALRAGASGYLVKGSGLEDLVLALETIVDGGRFLCPALQPLLDADAGPRPSSEPLGGATQGIAEPLTSRETEVLQRVGEGLSSAEIAHCFGLSVKTIEGHRGRLMDKLGARNVADLVRHAVRLGLVELL